MLDSSNSALGEGNTKPLPKQISPSIRWCFTWHKPNDTDCSEISAIIERECRYGIFSMETGEEGTTPHLQGYVEFKKKVRPKGVFGAKWRKMHWEKAKGTRAQNVTYVTKESGWCYYWPKRYNIDIKLYDWQKEIVSILREKPDDRTIHWYWEPDGCAGKTTFQKWIYLNFEKTVVLSGKCEDMKNGIIQYKTVTEDLPRNVLINIPKCNSNFVSISGMEQIKDMFFYCGKYEGGMVCGANPHVFVFANEPPDLELMSKDRWKVVMLPPTGGGEGPNGPEIA